MLRAVRRSQVWSTRNIAKACNLFDPVFFRWVNIGKERDGMQPDAVQYARALRPPYHLLSFLRIKGYSTKGMSCTDKNTMVRIELSV